jgi:ribosomal protein S18 acetylase RimI-like enzyme
METNSDRIIFQPALPGRGEDAARLIIDTDPHLWDCFFQKDHSLALRFLATQWNEERGLFSHSHAMAAMAGDRLAGIVAGFDGKEMEEALPHTAKAAGAVLAPQEFNHFIEILGYVRFLSPAIPEEAYYVLFLAARPEMRGAGLGGRLLTNAFDRAREKGYDACHLDVTCENPAVRFYEHMGMQILSETRVLPLEACGVGSHYRMVRKLR